MVKKIGRKHAKPDLKTALVLHRGGSLPLHMACRSKASAGIVKMLLDQYPMATEVQNSDGDLPLHLACKYGSSADVVRMLIDASPRSTQVKNKAGKKPSDLLEDTTVESDTLLHQVCHSGVPFEILHVLVDSYPEGCSKDPRREWANW
jgi:ankyrin repeat protein